jgi:hypothetical protein
VTTCRLPRKEAEYGNHLQDYTALQSRTSPLCIPQTTCKCSALDYLESIKVIGLDISMIMDSGVMRIWVAVAIASLLFKTQLNSIGLSVPHRKHITSPLLAQQINAVYRFVTMVY